VTAGLVVLVYGIVETANRSWTSPATILTFALAAVLLGTFTLIEARLARAPLMPLSVFRSRSLTGANLVIFFLGAAMFAMWFFLSLFMQNVLHFNPLKTGIAFLPQTVAIAIGAQISSRLVTRIGPRPLLVVAGLLAAVGMAWLSRITPDGTYLVHILGPSAVITFALGLAFTPVTFAATAGVPMDQAGLASGLVNTNRQVGGSIGLAVLATLAVHRTQEALSASQSSPGPIGSALTSGFSRAFSASVWLLLGAAAAAAIIPSISGRHGVRRTPEPEAAPAGTPALAMEPAEERQGDPRR
jgi:predicted MFS family arabinose efflux permease